MDDMPQRKKIGILGGTGWPSTVHYYSELCRRSDGPGSCAKRSLRKASMLRLRPATTIARRC
jgi:aspartate/glutamate racemase